jgi:hypothetical protein
MTLSRAVSDVVAERTLFEIEAIDRMLLNLYVPTLQHPRALVGYVHTQLGLPIASTAPLAVVSARFEKAIHAFAAAHDVPVVHLVKGQRKDDVAHEYLEPFLASGRKEGVLFIGRAQEKTAVFRTEKRRDREGKSYPWIVKTTAMVNHWYFYGYDDDFGPFFLKFAGYFPYNAKLCLNGNEYAKRQAAKAGIAFEALDNAFAAVSDAAAVQRICDGMDAAAIDGLARKWLARLPHPFSPADRAAGYRYDISILQAEFSLTQMLDQPVSGRVFFEQVIRDNLDIGRPDQVALVFSRRLMARKTRPTPGTFRTRIITTGVTPSLYIDYKSTRIKQYHKEGRALRTETTINNSYDFSIGRRLTNLPALREIGFTANRRLLDAQRLSHDPINGAEAFHAACAPVIHADGTRTAGLRFTDPRAQALLHILLIFRLQPGGFTNAGLRALLAEYLGRPPRTITPGQATYDLRRLKDHGFIERIPHSHRYRITGTGLAHAMFLARAHDRLLITGLAELTAPAATSPIRRAAPAYQAALDDLTTRAGLRIAA